MKIKKAFAPFEIHIESEEDLKFINDLWRAAYSWTRASKRAADTPSSFEEQILLFSKDLQK